MPTTRSYRKNGRTGRNFTTSRNTGSSAHWPTFKAYAPTHFRTVGRCISQCIGSFRNIQSQFSGMGRVTAFSPNTVNRWVKYVNNGAYVYKFNHNEFCRYFGTRFSNPTTTTAACRFLRNRFGAGIKDVTRGKGGSWLIAASPNVTARPFSNYKW